MKVLKAVESVNDKQKHVIFNKLNSYYDGNLHGRKIALWGLAFKPQTDDMREATSLVTIDLLLKAGATVTVYDPVAMDECRRRLGDAVEYATDAYDAVKDADALLMLTEWKEFRMPDWGEVKKAMKHPAVFDGRNIYDKKELNEAGFHYSCIGKK